MESSSFPPVKACVALVRECIRDSMESFGMISLQNETMNSRPFIVKSFPAHKWDAAARKSVNEKQ